MIPQPITKVRTLAMAGAFSVTTIMAGSSISVATPPGLNQGSGQASQAVLEHIDQLQTIAESNGGHREAGSRGHKESVSYFERVLRDAGLDVHTEPFEFLYSKPERADLAVGGERFDLVPATFSPSTDSPLRAPAHFLSGEGCSEAEYSGVPRGSILVLKEPSDCTVQQQHGMASESGAAASLVASDDDVPPYIWLDGAGSRDIPTAGIAQSTAETIRTSSAPVSMNLDMVTERRSSVNLIAESPGTEDSVIELGAHLDSVPQGPGINDNAVSAAILLEQAIASDATPHRKTHRFMFWSGEEFAFAGSRSYLRHVENAESIEAYINLELVAAPNSGFFYASGDGSRPSRIIETAIIEGYRDLGLDAERDPNELPRSDDSSYQDAGIPTGGFWGGSFEMKTQQQAGKWGGTAGEPFDSCYHQPCDTADRIDETKVSITADVVDHTLKTTDEEL